MYQRSYRQQGEGVDDKSFYMTEKSIYNTAYKNAQKLITDMSFRNKGISPELNYIKYCESAGMAANSQFLNKK